MLFTYNQLNSYLFEKLLFEGTKSGLALVTSTYIDNYSHMLYNLFTFFCSW